MESKLHMKSCLFLLSWCLIASFAAGQLHAKVHDVRDYGAKGDGKTDDTAAIQEALSAASRGKEPGPVLIPTGNYLVSKTLIIDRVSGLIVRGEGSRGIGVPLSPNGVHVGRGSCLIWAGQAGGTLLETKGIGACSFYDLAFSGRDQRAVTDRTQRAGILWHVISPKNHGNMINRLSGISFNDADVGLQMGGGTEDWKNNDSDILFDFLTFRDLGTGFLVKHLQGVNYQFNFLFGLGCGIVLHFEKGGNVMASNLQLTGCYTAVRIDQACRNSGTYQFNNLRMEGFPTANENTQRRSQLLVCNPKEQAMVRFTNYDDVQWWWYQIKDPAKRHVPLCEIGPGTTVVFETSIFNSPLARVTGEKNHPARLIVRDSHFNYVMPEKALAANEFGYYKILDCSRDNGGNLLANYIKWPATETVIVSPNTSVTGSELQPPPATAP